MNVLITGASTGIGEACARRLDGAGHRVFAGVRREEDGARLREGSSARLEPVILDLEDGYSIDEARARVEHAVGDEGLHGLVNNAGIAVAGPLEYLPLDDLRRQLEINVVGQIAVTQAFMRALKKARGRIVFMGSIGGRFSTPFLGPYCASKFALEAIADALRVEVQPFGIEVALIEPGSIATPIWAKSDGDAARMQERVGESLDRDYGSALGALRGAARKTGERGIPPDAVARAVEHALTAASPRTRYLVGRDARLRAALTKLVPDRLRDRLVTRALKLPARG